MQTIAAAYIIIVQRKYHASVILPCISCIVLCFLIYMAPLIVLAIHISQYYHGPSIHNAFNM